MRKDSGQRSGRAGRLGIGLALAMAVVLFGLYRLGTGQEEPDIIKGSADVAVASAGAGTFDTREGTGTTGDVGVMVASDEAEVQVIEDPPIPAAAGSDVLYPQAEGQVKRGRTTGLTDEQSGVPKWVTYWKDEWDVYGIDVDPTSSDGLRVSMYERSTGELYEDFPNYSVFVQKDDGSTCWIAEDDPDRVLQFFDYGQWLAVTDNGSLEEEDVSAFFKIFDSDCQQ